MITVNTKRLTEAVMDADTFKLPDMSEGTAYLYDDIYKRLSRGEDVRLSSLDFDAFERSDVDSLNDLHSDVFERNHCAANAIASTLRAVAPASKAVVYV